MAILCKSLTYIAAIVSILPLGLSALPFYKAGNASFTTSQRAAFWSSDMGNYTLGFSPVNGGHGYLLSVWRSGDPNQTAIWWAGSNNSDPTVKAGASFNFTSMGALELHSSQGTLIWSTNTTSFFAHLEDNGCLVLLGKNQKTVLWQSFDHSRNSLILVDLNEDRLANKSFFLQSAETQSSYAPGTFHIATDAYLNAYFHGVDVLNNDFVYLYASMKINNGFEIGRDYGNHFNISSGNSTDVLGGQLRLTLDYDGNLRVYMWESNVNSWKAVWQMIDDVCMLGSPCGPFGICMQIDGGKNGINCSCPSGYHPRVAGNISQGCESYVSFNAGCGAYSSNNYNITMTEVPHSDYDYDDLSNQQNVGLDDCKALCLNDCMCMAASYTDSGVCFLKGNSSLGYLLNGYTSDVNTLLVKVVESLPSNVTAKKRGQLWVVVGVAVGGGCAVLLVLGAVFWFACRSKGYGAYLSCWATNWRHEVEAAGEVGPVKFFRYEELVMATGNFSEKLGEGGFGVVYKGWLKVGPEDRMRHDERAKESPSSQQVAVAVKMLKGRMNEEKDGGVSNTETQFRAEVRTLGKIHHVNLVSLWGYCVRSQGARQERLLVFEYMENGSLDRFLSGSQPPLPWPRRYSIAVGAARGIAYLHHECSPPILHCDIKPHNILLSNDFTAKVADFGFAKRFHMDSHITMSGIRGTRGYIAPEWLTSQQLSSKVDVFSYGILLLELVRGFKRLDEINVSLLGWATQCILEGIVPGDDNVMQVSSSSNYENQAREAAEKLHALKVGMWCVQHNPFIRPPMSRIVQLIEGMVPMEDPPIPRASSDFVLPDNLPTFVVDTDSSSTASNVRNFSYSVVSAR